MKSKILALLLWAIAAVPVQATDVEVMPISKVVSLSSHVCWATVESATARWAEGHREIETVLHLVDSSFLKGDGPAVFDLVVPGGTLGEWTMKVEGAPQFREGERWMFFLLPEWRTHPCAGMWQGAYRAAESDGGMIVRGGVVGGDREVGGLDDHGHPRAPADGEAPLSVAEWTKIVSEACALDAVGRPVAEPAQGQGAAISTRVWPSHRATPMRDNQGRPLNASARAAATGASRGRATPVPAVPMPREEMQH